MTSSSPPEEFAVFLRGISNVPMQPLRDALLNLGLTDVRSFGGTGNMLFCARDSDPVSLERQVAGAVGVEAFLRNRTEMATIVAGDPFAGRPGASLFFAHGPIDAGRAASLLAEGFEGEPPVIAGRQVYFVHPLRRPGRAGIIDFERELGVRGTMRASRVVARVLSLMR